METFVEYASAHRELLLDVLRHSSDPTHRAVAAHVLGYAPDKRDVVEPLSRAVLDPDEGVRNNATRALAVIAGYASDNPEAGITLRPDPFIGLLGSAVWSDRNKGLAVLDPLTVRRDPDLLDELRRRSLPSLVEMCRWKNWGHALGACVILRRVVGLPDDFDPASREETIAAATRPVR